MESFGGGNPDSVQVEYDAKKHNTHGLLLLDAVMWEKVIPNHVSNTVIMVCNKAYIGKQEFDKVRDEFMELARKSSKLNYLLFSQIIVNGAENSRLVETKFNIERPSRMTTPQFFLVKSGETTSIPLQTESSGSGKGSDKSGTNIGDIVYHVQKLAGVSFGLDGTNPDMDALTERFMSDVDNVERRRIIEEGRFLQAATTDSSISKNMDTYIKTMEKILEKGLDGTEYAKSEIKRLESILESDKVSDDRKAEFKLRVNILASFNTAPDLIVTKAENVAANGSEIE